MSSAEPPSEQMVSEAAYWLTAMNDEQATATDRDAFDRWCNADPRHRLALSRMQSLWGSLDGVPAAPARIALNRAFSKPRSKLAARGGQTLALLLVLAGGWFGQHNLPIWLADQRTAVGERRAVTLADGSQLQLNSNSAVGIHFDGQRRVITLLKGELWVVVAKDTQRPFVVRTEQGSVTALGTRFLVRRVDEQATEVNVIESAIAAQAGDGTPVRVSAGERTRFTEAQVSAVQPIGNAAPSAWTRGLLKVDDRPLSEVLEAIDGYRHGLLRFDAAALAGLRVSGVFRLDDTDAALAALSDNLPIKVEYFTPLLVTVKPKD